MSDSKRSPLERSAMDIETICSQIGFDPKLYVEFPRKRASMFLTPEQNSALNPTPEPDLELKSSPPPIRAPGVGVREVAPQDAVQSAPTRRESGPNDSETSDVAAPDLPRYPRPQSNPSHRNSGAAPATPSRSLLVDRPDFRSRGTSARERLFRLPHADPRTAASAFVEAGALREVIPQRPSRRASIQSCHGRRPSRSSAVGRSRLACRFEGPPRRIGRRGKDRRCSDRNGGLAPW